MMIKGTGATGEVNRVCESERSHHDEETSTGGRFEKLHADPTPTILRPKHCAS